MGPAEGGQADGISVIRSYIDAHHPGSVSCIHAEGKGRTLRAAKPYEQGELIFVEPALLVVDLPPNIWLDRTAASDQDSSADAYEKISNMLEQLGRRRTEAEWFWFALRSLTASDLGSEARWEPLEQEQQDQLLLLHRREVEVPSEASERIAACFAPGLPDGMKLELCLQAWKSNAFDHSDVLRGAAVYFMPSFMSHSCFPNAAWSYGESDTYILRACRRIHADDEITISYLADAEMQETALYRQRELFTSKQFWCTCERCQGTYDYSRGMRCAQCFDGTVFAWTPSQQATRGSNVDIDHILKPLRPTVYTETLAKNLGMWLTMGAPTLQRSSGKFYYELTLGEGFHDPQIGWATDRFEETEAGCGLGVGDDAQSWGADGQRKVWWHDGQQRECDDDRWSITWSTNATVGCAIDIDAGEMFFSDNGHWGAGADITFEARGRFFYPAASLNGDFAFHLEMQDFEYSPPDRSFLPWKDFDASYASQGVRHPLNRRAPLQGGFAGAPCQLCGFVTSVAESQRFCKLETLARRIMKSWPPEEDALPVEDIEDAYDLLGCSFAQHVLADKVRERLAASCQDGDSEKVSLLRERCDFEEGVYPGPLCRHAFALEAYADALTYIAQNQTSTQASQSEMMENMKTACFKFEKSLNMMTIIFGSEYYACERIETKLAECVSALGRMTGKLCA